MKRRIFICTLVCMICICSIASANTITFSGKLRNYTQTADTAVSSKNDDEDRFYITLTDELSKTEATTPFSGRVRE